MSTSMSSFGGGSGSMLVLNDPAAQLNADGKATAPTGPVTNLSAFASSNDIVVKVCVPCSFSVVTICAVRVGFVAASCVARTSVLACGVLRSQTRSHRPSLGNDAVVVEEFVYAACASIKEHTGSSRDDSFRGFRSCPSLLAKWLDLTPPPNNCTFRVA